MTRTNAWLVRSIGLLSLLAAVVWPTPTSAASTRSLAHVQASQLMPAATGIGAVFSFHRVPVHATAGRAVRLAPSHALPCSPCERTQERGRAGPGGGR